MYGTYIACIYPLIINSLTGAKLLFSLSLQKKRDKEKERMITLAWKYLSVYVLLTAQKVLKNLEHPFIILERVQMTFL